MTRNCEKCTATYDDAKCSTLCPHNQFISDEAAKQKDLAISLAGKDLWFAHMQEGVPFRIQSIGHTGMVSLVGMVGEFAPHLFVVKP